MPLIFLDESRLAYTHSMFRYYVDYVLIRRPTQRCSRVRLHHHHHHHH